MPSAKGGKIHLSGGGSASARKVSFENLNKDTFLEVQNEAGG